MIELESKDYSLLFVISISFSERVRRRCIIGSSEDNVFSIYISCSRGEDIAEPVIKLSISVY